MRAGSFNVKTETFMEYLVVLGTALMIALYAFVIGRALGKLDR